MSVTYRIKGNSVLTGAWTTLAEKVDTGPWAWLGDGTAHLSEGTAAGGRRSVQVGTPDAASQ